MESIFESPYEPLSIAELFGKGNSASTSSSASSSVPSADGKAFLIFTGAIIIIAIVLYVYVRNSKDTKEHLKKYNNKPNNHKQENEKSEDINKNTNLYQINKLWKQQNLTPQNFRMTGKIFLTRQ